MRPIRQAEKTVAISLSRLVVVIHAPNTLSQIFWSNTQITVSETSMMNISSVNLADYEIDCGAIGDSGKFSVSINIPPLNGNRISAFKQDLIKHFFQFGRINLSSTDQDVRHYPADGFSQLSRLSNDWKLFY